MPVRTIGERIRHYRMEKNLSIPELAEAAGISAARLRELEGDKKNIETMEAVRLALVLDVTCSKLITGVNDPE